MQLHLRFGTTIDEAHRGIEQPEPREDHDRADDERGEQLDEREAALVGEARAHHAHVPDVVAVAMSMYEYVDMLKFVFEMTSST